MVSRTVLRRWLEELVLPAFAGRIPPFSLPAAKVLAGYRVREYAPLDDALIAAIARCDHVVVVTRNGQHFELLDCVRLNLSA